MVTYTNHYINFFGAMRYHPALTPQEIRDAVDEGTMVVGEAPAMFPGEMMSVDNGRYCVHRDLDQPTTTS